jgi:hypothetical protein
MLAKFGMRRAHCRRARQPLDDDLDRDQAVAPPGDVGAQEAGPGEQVGGGIYPAVAFCVRRARCAASGLPLASGSCWPRRTASGRQISGGLLRPTGLRQGDRLRVGPPSTVRRHPRARVRRPEAAGQTKASLSKVIPRLRARLNLFSQQESPAAGYWFVDYSPVRVCGHSDRRSCPLGSRPCGTCARP